MLQPSCQELHRELGIPADFASRRGLPEYAEAAELVEVGPNLVGRVQRLTPEAAAGWRRMAGAAAEDGIALLIVSGYRSHAYQAELIRRKLAQGERLEEILRVNAPPGYSEHHSGLAVDVATPGCRPLTEEFEHSQAFAWLGANAGKFGFSLTYPRGNPLGFIYEPWHWALTEKEA